MADMKDKMKGAIDTGADKAKQGVDRAADAFGGNRGNMGAGNMGGSSAGVVGQAKDVAHDAAHAVSDFAHQARDKAGNLIDQVKDKAGDWADDVSGTAKDVGHTAQRWAGDAYDYTADHMKDFGSELTSMVRKYPIPALLVGFGVGLLLGRAAKA